jgi:hypothetical protein
MSSVTRPRGPLPARVYWFRRALVGVVAVALVFGVAQLLGGSPDPGTPTARPASAGIASDRSSSGTGTITPSRTPSVDGSTAGGSGGSGPVAGTTGTHSTGTTDQGTSGKHGKKGKKSKRPEKTPLPEPTGTCLDSDVNVEPTLDEDAYAGRDVVITLNLTTDDAIACTWKVSPRSVVLQVTSGDDLIWTTQDCPGAVPTESVTVRKESSTKVELTWPGRRSDDECSRGTAWALPGYYHAEAAAMGAEPDDQQFRLRKPVAPTITATPKPKNKSGDEQNDAAASDGGSSAQD